MAKIEAEVTANIGPFQKALHHATEQAREFGEKVKEVGTDIGKETMGGGLSKMLGLAGATVAVTAFGVALVDAAKEGIKAFSEFEQIQLKIKENLKHPEMSEEITEKIEKSSGHAGSFAVRGEAYAKLLEAGFSPGKGEKEKQEWPGGIEGAHMEGDIMFLPLRGAKKTESGLDADKMLSALDEWSAKTGESQSQMAETLRMIHAGGADAGEGVNRAIKSFRGLDVALQPLLDKFRLQTAQPTATLEDMAKAHAINYQQIAGAITSGAPKHAVEDEGATLKGHMDDFAARMDEMKEKIGKHLAPAMEKVMDSLIEHIPEISAVLETSFGALAKVTDGVVGAFSGFYNFIEQFSFMFHGGDKASVSSPEMIAEQRKANALIQKTNDELSKLLLDVR